MKLCLFLGLFIFQVPAFAQKAKVLVIDPMIETKDLTTNFDVERPVYHNSLPKRNLRDKTLAGIQSSKAWDEVKKDIFYMDLKSKNLNDLKKKYPEVSTDELKKVMGKN